MSFQEELYYKIEAYLSGELDAEEVAAFEHQLSADDLLKREVEKHKIANALIIEQRLLSVKGILQEERIKDFNSNNSFNPFGFILLAVAAVGIGTSIWMFNKEDVKSSSSNEVNTTNQSVSATNKADNKNTSADKIQVTKDAVQPVVATTDNGFHKQQIQQIEEHVRADEKGTLYIDTTSVFKKAETDSSPVPVTKNPISKNNTAVDPAPCSIQATVKATASCSHDATGVILVNNIQGGTKPYSITFSSSNNEPVTNGALSKGVYKALVSDASGCTQTYSNIVIAEKECPIDYSFNPFYGDEEWYIAPGNSEGHLEIYDKGGVLYYQRTLPALMAFKWSGTGINNQTIPGYYIFVIKYADGTSRRGSVTIVQ